MFISLGVMLTSSYILMTYKQDEIVITKPQDVIIEIKPEISEIPDILKKIAFCESGNKQFNSDGEVVKHFNRNGTIDYGIMQINSIHLLESERLGIDIMTEKGNLEMAKILYERHGARIWFGYDAINNKCVWEQYAL